MRESDIHHLFWTRADWNAGKVTKLIRNERSSMIEMHKQTHMELHRHVEPVKPPVEREMAEKVLWAIRNLPTRYEGLDAVKAMRDAIRPEAEYLSDHLGRQVPFLELSKEALSKRFL